MEEVTTSISRISVTGDCTLSFRLIFKNKYIRSIVFQQISIIHKQLIAATKIKVYKYHDAMCRSVDWLATNKYIGLCIDRSKKNQRLKFGKSLRSIISLITTIEEFKALYQTQKTQFNISRYEVMDMIAVCPTPVFIYAYTKYGERILYVERKDLGTHVPVATGYKLSLQCIHSAAQSGRLQTLEYIYTQCGDTGRALFESQESKIMSNACKSGNIELVKWIIDHDQFNQSRDIINSQFTQYITDAASSNNLEMIKLLIDHPLYTDASKSIYKCGAMQEAAKNGNLEMLKYIYELTSTKTNNFVYDMGLTLSVIISQSKSLECIKYLVETVQIPTSQAYRSLADTTMEIAEYLCSLPNQSNTNYPIYRVISQERFDLAKYLIERCNVTEGMVTYLYSLMYCKNDEMVKYILKDVIKKFPDKLVDVLTWACTKSIEMFHYCLSLNQTPTDNPLSINWFDNDPVRTLTRLITRSLETGSVAVAEYLIQTTNITFDDHISVYMICNQGHIGSLMFLMEKYRSRITITKHMMNSAAGYGRLEIVKYLHFNDTVGCTYRAIDEACMNGHFHVVEFLLTHRLEGYSPNATLYAKGNGHKSITRFLNVNSKYIKDVHPTSPHYVPNVKVKNIRWPPSHPFHLLQKPQLQLIEKK